MSAESFLASYIAAALWSTNDESTPEGGEPFYRNYSREDIVPESLAKMAADCERFQKEAGDLISEENYTRHNPDSDGSDAMAGHDFWLTRNGHGAGFWDGDWSAPAGDKLTALSKQFGEVDLYLGDDGKIYQS